MDNVMGSGPLEPQHSRYSNLTHAETHSPSHDDNRVKVGLRRAHQIDLSMVRMKLMDTEQRTMPGSVNTDDAISYYREFLALLYAYPEKAIVPSRIIDAVWHHHILDTRAYANDTRSMFGYFLHHYPYFGMRGSDDAKLLANSFAETCALWQKHFGRSPSTTPSPSRDMGGCGGGKCSSCKS